MILPDSVGPVPVTRDCDGYWTHPRYFLPAYDHEYGAPGEFDAWLKQHCLAYALSWMENEVPSDVLAVYRVSDWQPARPAGTGWFIASIHDTDEGPVCVWLREAPCGEC